MPSHLRPPIFAGVSARALLAKQTCEHMQTRASGQGRVQQSASSSNDKATHLYALPLLSMATVPHRPTPGLLPIHALGQ